MSTSHLPLVYKFIMSTEDAVWSFDPSLPDNGPTVSAAVWSVFAVATAFLGLRVFCKLRSHHGLWWDDHVLIASWVFFLAAAIQLSVNIAHGFGRPGINIDPANSYQVGLGGMVVGTLVLIAPALSKTSFLLTVGKISGSKLKKALWFIAVSMNALQVVALVIQFAQCSPLEKVWNPWADGRCWGRQANLAISMTSSAYSGIMDLVLAAIPWIILKDLQIKRREKIGIAIAMSLGVIAAITAFIKCNKQKILASSDFTLEGGELIIWASTEISATIIAACVPVLRTLVKGLSTGRGGQSGGYFRSGSGIDRRKSHTTGKHNTPGGTFAAHDSRPAAERVLPDASSDTSILENRSGGKIVKTEEVAVQFSERGDDSSVSYELHEFDVARSPGARQ
ncbi:uncharacterized protein J7T54_000002 [Emericellopsis cladophorae]|uniref:Rhodopsin domain-containing protein n=1 Tax=Emericellopsis cladophorae TaxID=2686198 RepID=A0A9P9XV43_9HYPO|nr:uncharacterized protein J7T54_000002 [Emericellopsis cladophorae]KAI6778193.1 hypothetical protein J7T54_000002 [Emericellopsis cladophorae]